MKMRIAQCATVIGLATAVMTATAALPSGYLEFEYIQGNGSDAKIVTDYTPTPNQDKIEAVISFPSGTLNQTQCIWCSRGNDLLVATWTLWVLNDSGYKFRFDYGTNDAGQNLTPVLSATDDKLTVTAEGPTFTSSGGQSSTHTKVADYTAGGPITLFYSYKNGTGNSPGNYGKFKLYSFKVWRSGDLIHNLVPAKRNSDSREGLYDVAANKFYAGTGSFTMGGVEFFHYDDGTALHGYQSYAEWLASANVGSSDASFTAEAELEARYRTMGESDGIALRSDWGRPLIIIVR